MSHGLYPPLDLPPVGPSQLRRGLKIQTRYFCADSAPASQATVVRHWTTRNGTWVRCSYGKTLNGKSIPAIKHSVSRRPTQSRGLLL